MLIRDLVGVVLDGAPNVECVTLSVVVVFVSAVKWFAIRFEGVRVLQPCCGPWRSLEVRWSA